MKHRGGSGSGGYKTMHILLSVLLVVGIFGAIIASFFSFSNKKSMFERFTDPTPSVSIEYYFKPGCPPCEAFNPIWNEFVEGNNKTPNHKYTSIKYDVTDKKVGSSRSDTMNISGTPTIIAVKDGKKIGEFNNSRTIENLRTFAIDMGNTV